MSKVSVVLRFSERASFNSESISVEMLPIFVLDALILELKSAKALACTFDVIDRQHTSPFSLEDYDQKNGSLLNCTYLHMTLRLICAAFCES